MKYMVMLYASQRDFDQLSGRSTDEPAWKAEDIAAMAAFMGEWNQQLVESGEFVDARGLAAPVHTRRFTTAEPGRSVITDGPYAETQEVLAGYTIIDCESFDRASELVARLADCPSPGGSGTAYADLRPIVEGFDQLDI